MGKQELTSIDVAAVVRELKTLVLNSRVSNIYQLDHKTLLFKLHKSDKPTLWLVLEAGKRLHLTAYGTEKPTIPPPFCMALRRYLRDSWLEAIEQYEFERIALFHFRAKTDALCLVTELFGDGNIILVDGKERIMQALTYKRMRDRNILRAETFRFPPQSGKNPSKVNREEFMQLREFGDIEVVRCLSRFLSIGGFYAEEILLRAEIDKKKPSRDLSDSELNALLSAVQTLLAEVDHGKLEPRIIFDEKNAYFDAVPFGLERYEGFENQTYTSFNEALDEFYTRVTAVEKAKAGVEVDQLRREAERLKRVIESQKEVASKTEAEVEHYRQIGDTIHSHAIELQTLLERFLTGRDRGDKWSQIVSKITREKKTGQKPSVFFESFDPKALTVNASVDNLMFGLDLSETLYSNAGRHYERSKRLKQKLQGTKMALQDTRKQLADVEAKIMEVEFLESAKPTKVLEELAEHKIKPKEWFEKFRWFNSSDGFLVVAGKDAVTNEVLIKKYTESSDLVFHADIVGAPFVVVKTHGKEPSQQALREAAEFAAAFSRGWREGFGSVDVYWVKPEQLSKGGPSGESVAHGAFVVRGERNWLRGTPLTIALGAIIRESGEIQFVGGPVDAVKSRTRTLVVLGPGDLTGKELFKLVLRTLAGPTAKEAREKILKTSSEKIREFIPFNKGRILKA